MLRVDVAAPVRQEIVQRLRRVGGHDRYTIPVGPHFDSDQHDENIQWLIQLHTDALTQCFLASSWQCSAQR